jgi:hypothetical protein
MSNPICIIISPDHTEGFSFTYNPAILAPALCKTSGDAEQAYGRVLRKYGRAPKNGRYFKQIYQYFGSSEYDLNNLNQLERIYATDKEIHRFVSQNELKENLMKTNEKPIDFAYETIIEKENKYLAETKGTLFGTLTWLMGTVSSIIPTSAAKLGTSAVSRPITKKISQISANLENPGEQFTKRLMLSSDEASQKELARNILEFKTNGANNDPTEEEVSNYISSANDYLPYEDFHLIILERIDTLSRNYFKELVKKENETCIVCETVVPQDLDFIREYNLTPEQRMQRQEAENIRRSKIHNYGSDELFPLGGNIRKTLKKKKIKSKTCKKLYNKNKPKSYIKKIKKHKTTKKK